MCFYITATLPNNTDIQTIQNIFNQYDLTFTPIKNDIVQSQLRPEELYFRITKNYCDCDTALGSLNRFNEYQKLLNSKKIKSLRKKKWKEEQIHNWIQAKLEDKNSIDMKKITLKERDIELEKWLSFLHNILDDKLVKHLGIIKHWYDKNLECEEILIKKIQKININDVNYELLLELEEDILYEFIPSYTF